MLKMQLSDPMLFMSRADLYTEHKKTMHLKKHLCL